MDKIKEETKDMDLAEQRQNELLKTIKKGCSAEELRDFVSDYHEFDVAEILGKLTKDERRRLYLALSDEELSEIFSHLDNPSPFVEELTGEKAADIIGEMDSGDAVDILQELDEDKQKELIGLIDEESVRDLRLVAKFPDDEIGSLMTNDMIVINENFTIKQAMKSLVDQAAENDNISTLYVTGSDGTFRGAIALNDLFIARADTALADITAASYPYLEANDKIAEVIEKVKDYAEETLPVLSADHRLIGALTSESVLKACESEIIDDYTKLAAISNYEEDNPSLKKTIVTRLPWLIILLLLGLLVSAAISRFDGVIAIIPLAAFFQPMILGMSGNAGTQSLATTIRSLTERPNKKELRKKMSGEILISFLNGLILAVISFVLLGLYIEYVKKEPAAYAFSLSGCMALALMISITVSGICGCSVPVTFEKVGIDPAAASGPLITTISDLVSAVTFYGLCSLMITLLGL